MIIPAKDNTHRAILLFSSFGKAFTADPKHANVYQIGVEMTIHYRECHGETESLDSRVEKMLQYADILPSEHP